MVYTVTSGYTHWKILYTHSWKVSSPVQDRHLYYYRCIRTLVNFNLAVVKANHQTTKFSNYTYTHIHAIPQNYSWTFKCSSCVTQTLITNTIKILQWITQYVYNLHLLPYNGILSTLILGLALECDDLDTRRVGRDRNTNLNLLSCESSFKQGLEDKLEGGRKGRKDRERERKWWMGGGGGREKMN